MGECSSSAAKTSVWWDIDKCAVPRGRADPHRIAYNIIGALAAAGYAGPVSIAAYGDAARVAPPVLHALSATGICLTHVPAGSKDTSDKRMLVDMLFWAFDNPPPGNFLLISGDRDFSDLLHRLRMKRYNILLVRPSNASSQILAAAAKTVWLWESIAAGEVLRPESPPASSMLGCKLNVHNASDVLGCKPNLNNLDPFKFSQNKILLEHDKGSGNVKASNHCRLKPLQKYVKKSIGASGPTENQDPVESVGGVSESSVGSTVSELDQSSIPSSSSSSCNSNEGVCKPNLNSSEPVKCSHNKILKYGKGHENVKASNLLKPLQKYVKKATGASSPTENQDPVEPAGGNSKTSIGSTENELDHSSVPSSSSSCHSNEGVSSSVLLETPALSKSSTQLSTQLQQMEETDRSILGEMPSTSTERVVRNETLDFGANIKHYNQTFQHQNELQPEFRIGDNNGKASNQYKVKPLQKYIKKRNTTFCSASNQVDLVQVPGCPKGSTKSLLDGSSVSSSLPLSSSEVLKVAKTEISGQPGSSTPPHSSAKKSVASACMHQVRASHHIFIKKPIMSVEHASRNGAPGFNVSAVDYHPTHHPTPQQSKSSDSENKVHSHSNMGGNNGKSGNGYKLNQQQMYVEKADVSSASSNAITPVHGFPDNPKGRTLSYPSQSMSVSSISETAYTAKLNQSPAATDNLHQECSGFIFGKKDGTSVQCTSQNGTSAFGFDNGHCHPTYQQSQSLLPEQNISTIPHPHDAFGHSHLVNSQIGSSTQPSAVFNVVSSTQIQALPGGTTFQGLNDICRGISRLNISECSQRTIEVKPLFQGAPSSNSAIGMASISGHSNELPEIRSCLHPDSDTSCSLSHSNYSQTSQPLCSDYTCRNLHPPPPSDMQNPGQHGEKPRYVPNSPDSEYTIGHILHALNILKAEKILPTESNIADCIHYGQMNLRGFDSKKALELAIRHQAVVMKKLLNDMPLFVPKGESLWKCVNVADSKAKNPIEALDTVHKYISSVDGHSAMKNSESRYQAATILKESCLRHYVLGDVLQILHIIIVRKKWLMPHSSGWQPLSLNTTGVIAPTDTTGKA